MDDLLSSKPTKVQVMLSSFEMVQQSKKSIPHKSLLLLSDEFLD